MAYYLENTADFAYVEFASYTIGGTIGDYFEFEGYATGAGNLNWWLAGLIGSWDNVLEITGNDVFLRAQNIESFFSSNYVRPAANVVFTFRLERTATNVWEGFLDGASIGSATNSGNFTFDQFFRLNNLSGNNFRGGIKRVTIKEGAITRTYDPSLSGGTGTTLPTDDGINEGSQGGTWPADDSEWVPYSAGPATPINLGTINLQATSARLTWEQG